MVRLYGCFAGHSSAATVTAGWKRALEQADMLAGCCSGNEPADADMAGEGLEIGGEDAPVALVTDIRQLAIANYFPHKERAVVLALHTRWVPETISNLLQETKSYVLSPSVSSIRCLHDAGLFDLFGSSAVVPHGVAPEFAPLSKKERSDLRLSDLYHKQLRGPGTTFLHMVESSSDRKGTWHLLEAFRQLIADGCDISLTIVASGYERMGMHRKVAETPELAGRVRVLPRMNAKPSMLRWVYACFDAVIQPSRAEGFGLCPLEALCVGTPVLITTDCGHAQWCFESLSHRFDGQPIEGVVPIKLGPAALAAFDPAEAPTITAEAIIEGVHAFLERSDYWKDMAAAHAASLREKWQWSVVTRPWLAGVERRYE